ncbi:hypothetical protein [Methylobacter sp. BBA5.1]|uniref:hypothetical protein n=1 Tax=Methylobacter sp. BBA5.1 TaxID=1495064 RepID=UPI00056476D2|nr:hypothetical protein [Methylobacter sp. BBA5.1]
MSESNIAKDQIEKIRDCNHVIATLSELMIEYQYDSQGGQKIPERLKGVYMTSGFLEAIKIAAKASEEALECLEKECDRWRGE